MECLIFQVFHLLKCFCILIHKRNKINQALNLTTEFAVSVFHCKMCTGNLLLLHKCPSSLASKICIQILLVTVSLIHLGLKESDLFRPSKLGQAGSGISVHVGTVGPGPGAGTVHFLCMAA